MKLLIPGGAGYIGSHMVKYAQERGHEVVVLDDFSTGHEWAIKDCEILRVDLLDQAKLAQLLKGRSFDGVIHFATKSLVGESVQKPDLYYRNNVVGTLNLVTEKIAEDHPKNPINPYGQSKLMVENMLRDICAVHGINATCFRYFNAAGADPSGSIGEAHDPETHLIPNILKSTISGGSVLKVFGNDYETRDGTCVRDYVHVTDLAQAHLLGLEHMKHNRGFSAFNLGNGSGFSVLEVIESCECVVSNKIPYDIALPREGDPARLVANSAAAIREIGWKPNFEKIDDIVASAWRWHNLKVS